MKSTWLYFFSALTVLLSGSSSAEPTASTEGGNLVRSLKVRAHEIFDKRKLRLYVLVDEYDSEGRYLLNTLDARSFRLFGKDAKEAPLDTISLSTVASKSPPVLRETAVVFESSPSLAQTQSVALRKSVAAFLAGFRSDVLTIRMGNEEGNVRLAWVSPGQSDNPRAIQRAVLDAPVLEGPQGLTPPACSAMRDLNVLQGQEGGSLVQRNLILVASEMRQSTVGFAKLAQCLTEAEKLGMRVFWVRLKTEDAATEPSNFVRVIESAVKKTGGFTTTIGLSAEPTAALNNIKSYLDDEYVLEFDLDRFQPYSDVIELELTASYHGHVLKSGFFKAEGFFAYPTPEDLARIAAIQSATKRKDINTIAIIAGVFVITGMIFWYRARSKVHSCGDCSFVVGRDFQDCPFRNPKCYGRLSVVQGPLLGKVFPLFSGDNTIGRKRSSTIRLKNKDILSEHGKIVISKRKALFTPAAGSDSRVNGVLATEPRLLGSGCVIKLGETVCRIDFKEG